MDRHAAWDKALSMTSDPRNKAQAQTKRPEAHNAVASLDGKAGSKLQTTSLQRSGSRPGSSGSLGLSGFKSLSTSALPPPAQVEGATTGGSSRPWALMAFGKADGKRYDWPSQTRAQDSTEVQYRRRHFVSWRGVPYPGYTGHLQPGHDRVGG
jgi:hypothetical protein